MTGLQGKLDAFKAEFPGVERVALSYSGGLDSAVVGTLLAQAGFSIHPVLANVGQQSDFPRIAENAKSMFGSCAIVDGREELADAIFRAIKTNFGSDGLLNGGGFVRPVFARTLAVEARRRKCQAVAHGSSGVGNDHLVMENSLRVIAPELRIMAPVRDLDLKRDSSLAFAKKENLKTNLGRAGKFSADESLWGRTIRQGVSIDQSHSLPPESYKWTVSPQDAPNRPETVEITFDNGIPVSVKVAGRKIKGKVKIIQALNAVGGKHAIGRCEAFEDKAIGLKIREVYECPGTVILLAAHRELEEMVLTARELLAKRYIGDTWAALVREGGWHTRLRHALDAFIDETSRAVDGTVSLELYKGGMSVKGRESRNALYDRRLSSRDSQGVFSQKEARHFAKLYNLQDVIAYMVKTD